MTHIELALISPALRDQVLAEYRAALHDEERRMTYHEAAWLYGYTYDTIRWLVCDRRLRTVGRHPNRRIAHAAMRAYMSKKKKTGTPRKAMRQLQLSLA